MHDFLCLPFSCVFDVKEVGFQRLFIFRSAAVTSVYVFRVLILFSCTAMLSFSASNLLSIRRLLRQCRCFSNVFLMSSLRAKRRSVTMFI